MIERGLSYFFAPIAAIRPYLVEKSVLVLVALDMWCLRLPAANRYDADDFNLSHFAWLDAFGPTPSAGLYIGIAVLVGFLAIAIAVTELGVWWRVALVVLYSYSWAMSRIDSFQHHYLLSWVLLCLVFFPKMESQQVFGGYSRKDKAPAKPLIHAWAWVLLSLLLAVVYIFTSMAKLDAVWQSGACLRQLQGAAEVLQPVESVFASIGYDQATMLRLVALATVVVELFLAACYLLPPIRDESARRSVQLTCLVAWLVAIALHAGFSLAGLKIGWFSSYMFVLASAYFLPESWLWPFGTPISRLIAQLNGRCSLPAATVTVACLAIAFSWWIDLPGTFPACVIGAIVLLASLFTSVLRNLAGRLTASLAVSLVILWMVIYFGNARSQFYPNRLSQLQRRGQYAEAHLIISQAEAYVDSHDLLGQNILAWFFAVVEDENLRDGAKAVKYGIRSCELCSYANISALDTLACAYAANGNFPQALTTIQQSQKLLASANSGVLGFELAEHQRLFSQQLPYVEVSKYRYTVPSRRSVERPYTIMSP